MAYKSKMIRKPIKTNKHNIAHRVMHTLEIPLEVLEDVSAITMWGNSYARVENHKGIVTLQPELIRLRTGDGIVSFSGKSLMLELLEGNMVRIKGVINTIDYLV